MSLVRVHGSVKYEGQVGQHTRMFNDTEWPHVLINVTWFFCLLEEYRRQFAYRVINKRYWRPSTCQQAHYWPNCFSTRLLHNAFMKLSDFQKCSSYIHPQLNKIVKPNWPNFSTVSLSVSFINYSWFFPTTLFTYFLTSIFQLLQSQFQVRKLFTESWGELQAYVTWWRTTEEEKSIRKYNLECISRTLEKEMGNIRTHAWRMQ